MRVDPNYVNGLVNSLNGAQSSEQQLSTELSSGLRVTSLSTDPVAVAQSTLIGAELSADDTYVSAATSAASKLQVTDSTLGEVTTQLTRAITLAVSGGDPTLTAAAKATIGGELTQIRTSVLFLANTAYQGQYIFAGSNGSVAPFSLTTATVPVQTTYSGDAALQYTTTETGQKIQTNVVGSDVFNSPGASAFTALNQVIADFNAGADSTTLGSDSSALTAALGQVGVQRGLVGTSLALVQSTSTYAQTDAAVQTAAEASLVGVNTAGVATSLSNVETQAQALISTISTLDKGSLFDYIK